MQKSLAQKDSPWNERKIFSVFCTPKIPSRIYFESVNHGAVARFGKGFKGLYMTTCQFIPVGERTALLCRMDALDRHGGSSESEKLKREMMKKEKAKEAIRNQHEWYWVRILTGLHKGDVGLVVKELPGSCRVRLKVIPRIDLKSTSTQFPVSLPGNTRFANRPPQRLVDKSLLHQRFGKDCIEWTETGYIFNGWYFALDNFRVLTIPRRDVVEYHPQLEQVSTFRDRIICASSSKHPLPDYAIPRLLPSGALVEVIEGHALGQRAHVLQEPHKGHVSLRLVPPVPNSNESVDITLPTHQVQRVFEVGQFIKVVIGWLSGRVGVVYLIQDRDLLVIDTLSDDVRDCMKTPLKTLKYLIVRGPSRFL